MNVVPHVLRRYVIDRASGRSPRAEWSYYSPDIGAWVRADEPAARRHEDHRRNRQGGRPWCDVLGHRIDVADDIALQLFFLTILPDDWRRLAIAVAQHPTRCLREWRASGHRLMVAVDPSATPSGTVTPGPLSDWPKARGTGPRSMLPR